MKKSDKKMECTKYINENKTNDNKQIKVGLQNKDMPCNICRQRGKGEVGSMRP